MVHTTAVGCGSLHRSIPVALLVMPTQAGGCRSPPQQPSRTSSRNFISGGRVPFALHGPHSMLGAPSLGHPTAQHGITPHSTTGPPTSTFPRPARAPAQTLAVPVIPAIFAISLPSVTQLRPVPAGRPFSSLGGWHAGSRLSTANLPPFCLLYSQSDHSAFYFPFQLLHKYPQPPRLLPFPGRFCWALFFSPHFSSAAPAVGEPPTWDRATGLIPQLPAWWSPAQPRWLPAPLEPSWLLFYCTRLSSPTEGIRPSGSTA